jgi:hypothetical protein
MASGVLDPSKLLTVVQDGLAVLIEQHKKHPVLKKITASYLAEVQILINAIVGLHEARIGTQPGWVLDQLGAIVGAERNSTVDSEYILWIRAKIAQNVSDGTYTDFERLAELTLGSVGALKITEAYPAALHLETTTAITQGELNSLKRVFGNAGMQSDGVRLQLVYQTSTHPFLFSNADSIANNSPNGFGDADSPSVTTYGQLSGVL